MCFVRTIGVQCHVFNDFKTLLAKTSPARSGDYLAGLAAASEGERMAARMVLADVPLSVFLNEALVPYEDDEVARLILNRHDTRVLGLVASLMVGKSHNWLPLHGIDNQTLASVAPDITPETAVTVDRLIRNQDPVAVARKRRVVARFRNTVGLPDRLSIWLQPNHSMNDPKGIAVSIIDGLLYGCGDVTIGINPADGNLGVVILLL